MCSLIPRPTSRAILFLSLSFLNDAPEAPANPPNSPPKELLDFSHGACLMRHFDRTREEDMHRKQRSRERRSIPHTERTRSSLDYGSELHWVLQRARRSKGKELL